ncbi:unnamed protein product [Lecanosticta acicola]|uniref:magnesium chelatase n=1 Tax=Lecanosticta acicola TaxID=111012 RepID=A0AAI8YRQ9_9PEZI|nr:unnamed protein product [Lecanosticta acicola]
MDASRLQDLGDLELGLLVSLVAGEHCIFATAPETISGLEQEIRLICTETFGLHPVTIECSRKTTVDEFNDGLLIQVDDTFDDTRDRHGLVARPATSVNFASTKDSTGPRLGSVVDNLEDRRIADVIIATGLDSADEHVQVQAFELLRSRRIFTRSSMHVAPKDLLFIAILSKPEARLTRHLNDSFCMYHFHGADDGLPHLEGSVIRGEQPTFLSGDIKLLKQLTDEVLLSAEIAQYLHNVVVFMRNSRYIKSGVTATATRQLRIISRALAPLHGMNYVPPSLVALAARKIYPHRLVLATAENEKSLLWGSDPEAIKQLLDGVTVEDVIEEVLASLEAPL